MTNYEQAADEMVEMFQGIEMDIIYTDEDNDRSVTSGEMLGTSANRIAIAHCKRVIEVLEKCHALDEGFILTQLRTHQSILSVLEGRVG